MLERADVLWLAAKRLDLCQERHVQAGGERLGAPDREIRSVKLISKGATSVRDTSAYLASSFTMDLLSTALSLCAQEESHLVRRGRVR